MKSKSQKFVGLVTTALATSALLSGAAIGEERNRGADYTKEASRDDRVRNQMSSMNSARQRRASSTLIRLLNWHDIMLDANARDHTPGPFAGDQNGPTRNSRAFAMISIAVFDAVNAFEFKYRPYNNIGRAPARASQDAAIAYAAYTTLVRLYPKQQAILDTELNGDLSRISASPSAVAAGRAIGVAAANAMINSRINTTTNVATDGAIAGEPAFGTGGVVGGGGTTTFFGGSVNGGQTTAPNWTPDPAGLPRGVALGARWGNVRPFVLTSGNQFRIPAPPAPGTAAYRAAYNEVLTVGASADTPGSTTTQQFQFIGNFWGYDGAPLLGTPPRLYNQIAVKVANDQGLRNVAAYARYLALVNSTMGDSGIAAWDSKYFYNYWRPVTGIRANDGDATTPTVAGWKPFGASVINAAVAEPFTPPFPAYPSGHATFGAATFESMRDLFPNNTRFTFVSDEYNGTGVDPKGDPRPFVPVRYRSLQEAQEENGQSRVYNGVHWQYDNTTGQNLGVKIARYTIANAFQRSRRDHDDRDDD